MVDCWAVDSKTNQTTHSRMVPGLLGFVFVSCQLLPCAGARSGIGGEFDCLSLAIIDHLILSSAPWRTVIC